MVPTAPDWPAWVEFMVNTHFDLVSGPFGTKGALKGLVLALKGPFGDLGGPRRAPVGQIWSQLPSNGLMGLNLWSPHHFDLISGPLRVPRGPKGVIWAQSLNFHGPIFFNSFLFQI